MALSRNQNKTARESKMSAGKETQPAQGEAGREGLENMVLVMLEQLRHRVSKDEVAEALARNHGDVLNTMRELESCSSVEETQELGLDSLVTAIQIHFASFIPRQQILQVLNKHGGNVVEAMSELQTLSQQQQQQHSVC